MAWPHCPTLPHNFQFVWKFICLQHLAWNLIRCPNVTILGKLLTSIYFSASWLCFPHLIGSLTRRQKQIIDNISCVQRCVTWVNEVTCESSLPCNYCIAAANSSDPDSVIHSHTGWSPNLIFYKFYPQSAFIVRKIELEPDDQEQSEPMILQSWVSAHFIICSRNYLLVI